MSVRKGLDRRPGPLPEIEADSVSVTFVMEVNHLPHGELIVIRCDVNGNVWAAIRQPD